jgi:hypothetical protein
MTTLLELIRALDTLPPETTLYAAKPWSPTSEAAVADDDEPPMGLDYLLEVDLAQQTAVVWSDWRNGARPTELERCEAVIHYAAHDAYLPLHG